jgi:hypothetical protein
MSYTPKLEDLDNTYTPSLADLNEASVNTAPKSNKSVNPLLAAGNFAEQNITQPLQNITQPVQNFLTATGQGVTNSGINAINTLSKFAGHPTNIQPFNVANTNNISGTLGNIAGNTAGFFGAGGIAKGIASIPAIAESLVGATNALSKIPYASKVVNALTSPMGQRAAGSAAYGASQDTDNPLAGAVEGGVTSLGADALLNGVVGKTINAIKKPFSASSKAEELLNDLSEGRSVEENSKAFAQKIKTAYEKAEAENDKLYKPVFDLTKNEKINEHLGPFNSKYETLDKAIFNEDYDRKLTRLHQKFMEEPNLKNAHELQSQLGYAIRDYKKSKASGNMSTADRNVMQAYQEARNSLKTDINNYLANKDPIIQKKYNAATQDYLENVVPYLSDSKISQIVNGEIKNPGILKTIFKNPEPEIQKIVSDIGESANKNILYDELGRIKNVTPEKLINSINNIGTTGLESYITPDIESQFGKLGDTVKNKHLAKILGGAAAGYGLGHLAPFGLASELAGLGAGGALAAAPITSNFLRKVLPENKNALNEKMPRLDENTKNAIRALAVGYATQ